MSAVNHLIGFCLILWVVATVGKNVPGKYLPRWSANFLSGKFALLLPSSSFFAPNPGKFDFFVVFRDRQSDRTGEWKQIECGLTSPLLLRGIWNPGKSADKILSDGCSDLQSACKSLLHQEHTEIPQELQITAPYLVLLKLAESQSRQFPPEETQFMVLRTDPENKFEPFFISNWHRLA